MSGARPSEESYYDAPEPIRGLPARLPAGEEILWQGEPDWRSMARHTFHVRKLAIYFGVLLAWDVVSTLYDGERLQDQAASLGTLAGLAVVALGVIGLFCYLVSRTTVYTVTSRRVVIRAGIALPKTINLPFVRIASAGANLHADGTGDLVLTPMASDKIAYLLLWPHAKAWNLKHAHPMLRCVADGRSVARILGEALTAGGEGEAVQAQPVRASIRRSAGSRAAAAA